MRTVTTKAADDSERPLVARLEILLRPLSHPALEQFADHRCVRQPTSSGLAADRRGLTFRELDLLPAQHAIMMACAFSVGQSHPQVHRPVPDGHFDVAVIGAGIVGLATARELLARKVGRVVVLEKEDGPARHQTGHNTGVIHSGVYYTPGSAKARLCVEGARLMVAYCDEHAVAYERCGKLVVARDERELAPLDELHRRGVANGLAGLRLVEADRIRDLEPHAVGARALHVPSAGIVSYARVAESFASDVVAAGGEIRYGKRVEGIESQADSVRLGTRSGVVEAGRVVACVGLHSDRLAALAGAAPEPRIVPFRGDYYLLRPERRSLVRGLIYGVPDPRFPFLGVHVSRRIDGAVLCGPNAVLAFAREGYRRTDIDLADLADSLGAPGFRRLARKYWRTGLAELVRDYWKSAFLAELRTYVPELRSEDLLPGPSGVRAQALSAEGDLLDDFVFDTVGRFLNVRNAPSPAATSSLAIAREIADRLARATS